MFIVINPGPEIHIVIQIPGRATPPGEAFNGFTAKYIGRLGVVYQIGKFREIDEGVAIAC